MIAVDQTRFGEGQGNCLAAAIASVLEVGLEEIPDLNAGSLPQLVVLNEWLRSRGLQFTWLPWPTYNGTYQDFYLVSGLSPRGLSHAIVANHRGEMAHDPHPSRAGIGDPEECGVFIAINPERYRS